MTAPARPPAEAGTRLAKRVAELVPCSRSQAEQYIEGGWVRVDGEVVETPQFRVLDQRIEIDPQARLAPLEPVTLLLHKPPGFDAADGPRPAGQLLMAASHAQPQDRSGIRPLKRHFMQLQCVTPLETGASGLVVFTQEWRVARKLTEDAALVEHEIIVEVAGPVTPETLARLNHAPAGGRGAPAPRVSLNQQTAAGTRLRFAAKGHTPGQIAWLCGEAGLQVTGMKRIRIGRVPLASLPAGQWRYLAAHERF
ncbi:RNA pseudouridine synthase [Variovorax terrae]|uniref:Dual-specificity RNA pseudouridine synthase RluF n=1 Tax=Variovorax terrae TaxID=2923278 RepID=A0A9X1VS66_9BURK|nr:RNA pseudouridine synthase [Variovorax terrae]MCJ0761955.1 RNA pseudouridine synthase [Variovorax terrae]